MNIAKCVIVFDFILNLKLNLNDSKKKCHKNHFLRGLYGKYLRCTFRNFKISYVLLYTYMSIKFTDISGLTSNTPISSAICFSIDTDSSI